MLFKLMGVTVEDHWFGVYLMCLKLEFKTISENRKINNGIVKI